MAALLHQGACELIYVERVADHDRTRGRLQIITTGYRLQQTLDRGHYHGGSLPAVERFQQPQPLAEDFIVQDAFASVAFPSGKLPRRGLAEQRQIFAEVVDVAGVGQHHDQRRPAGPLERRGGQRARRSPDSAESAAVTSRHTGQHLREAVLLLKLDGQIPQLICRGRSDRDDNFHCAVGRLYLAYPPMNSPGGKCWPQG